MNTRVKSYSPLFLAIFIIKESAVNTAMKMIKAVLWGTLILLFIPTPRLAAQTTEIPVQNPSFEDYVLPSAGSFTRNGVGLTGFGWTVTGGTKVGVLKPGLIFFNESIPDGVNTAYSANATISQVLNEVLAPNTIYTLEVGIGNQNNEEFGGYRVQLLAGGTLLAEDNNTLFPTNGTFATSIVTFNALTGDPNMGLPLEIRLVPLGGSTGFSNTNFDNVRLLVIGQTCVQPPPGLVSWWPGDGDANDIQDGNDGTLENGATFAPGLVGQAFSFDGVDSVVEIANEANFDFDRTDAFTIDAWVKSTSKAVGNQFIVAKQDLTTAVPGGYVLGIRDQDGDNLVMILQFSGSQFMLVDGTTDIIDGQFHHVAGVYDGSGTAAGIKLFVDGVQEATVVTQDNLGANTILNDAPLTIGTRKDNLSDVDFNGIIDEVEIYNRALSASEIQAIFDAGSAGKCRPATGFDLNHFECYKAWTAKGTPRFEPLEVTLDGQSGSKTVTVLKPVSICIPVDKNGEGIINPDAYLVCYRFKIKDAEEGAEPIKSDVLVQNQFGEQTLTVFRPHFLRLRFLRSYFLRHQTLCVPSTKGDLGAVGDDDG